MAIALHKSDIQKVCGQFGASAAQQILMEVQEWLVLR
jgi:hypothetical protein